MKPVTAYKYKKKIVRAEEIQETKVYICPHTDVVFEDRGLFGDHLVNLRRSKTAIRNYNKVGNELHNQPTIYDIQKFFNDNPILCFPTSLLTSVWKDYINKDYKFTISFSRMRYKSHCSNSHDAPLGKATNWGGREDGIPTGYAGLWGRVHLNFESKDNRMVLNAEGIKRYKQNTNTKNYSSFIYDPRPTDTLRKLRVCTGSGGGGNLELSYAVTLFLDDWIGLQNTVVERKLMGTLNDDDVIELHDL